MDQWVKNMPADAGDVDSTSGLGRSFGKGNGNPLLYSCLGNPKDRGAWQATVHGVTKELNTTYQLKQQSVYVNPNIPIYPPLTFPLSNHKGILMMPMMLSTSVTISVL